MHNVCRKKKMSGCESRHRNPATFCTYCHNDRFTPRDARAPFAAGIAFERGLWARSQVQTLSLIVAPLEGIA